MFFGFAQHKTFVEHFARPQTKTRSGLSISIHPSAIRRLGGEECGGDGGDAPRGGRLVGSPPESRAASLVLCGQSRTGGSRGADTHSPAFAFERGWFPGREVLLAPGPSASSFPSAGARELISGWGKAASLRSCSAAESSLLGPFHCVVSPAEEAHSLGESAYFRECWPARAALTPLPRSPDTFISSETGILVSIASGS